MKIVVKVSICTSSIVYKFVPTENYFKTKKKRYKCYVFIMTGGPTKQKSRHTQRTITQLVCELMRINENM